MIKSSCHFLEVIGMSLNPCISVVGMNHHTYGFCGTTSRQRLVVKQLSSELKTSLLNTLRLLKLTSHKTTVAFLAKRSGRERKIVDNFQLLLVFIYPSANIVLTENFHLAF